MSTLTFPLVVDGNTLTGNATVTLNTDILQDGVSADYTIAASMPATVLNTVFNGTALDLTLAYSNLSDIDAAFINVLDQDMSAGGAPTPYNLWRTWLSYGGDYAAALTSAAFRSSNVTDVAPQSLFNPSGGIMVISNADAVADFQDVATQRGKYSNGALDLAAGDQVVAYVKFNYSYDVNFTVDNALASLSSSFVLNYASENSSGNVVVVVTNPASIYEDRTASGSHYIYKIELTATA
jgi:hypothetical protein